MHYIHSIQIYNVILYYTHTRARARGLDPAALDCTGFPLKSSVELFTEKVGGPNVMDLMIEFKITDIIIQCQCTLNIHLYNINYN